MATTTRNTRILEANIVQSTDLTREHIVTLDRWYNRVKATTAKEALANEIQTRLTRMKYTGFVYAGSLPKLPRDN